MSFPAENEGVGPASGARTSLALDEGTLDEGTDPTPGEVASPALAESTHPALDDGAAPALELAGVVRRYGEREALSGVGLSLPPGRTLVVFGPNGAGKTTLLRVLATLLRPHAGRVCVLGSELPDDAWALRGRVGLLAHEPLLYRELSARQNLRYHARLHGTAERRIDELIDALALTGRAEEPVRTLSRGLVQRVAVARAVLHDPELLLLDEPYANLDPAAIALVAPLLGAGSDGRPRTRVICSHDPAGGLAEADVVLGLRAGRPELLAAAEHVSSAEVTGLYR